MKYQPPYTITPEILNRVAAISEAIGRLTVLTDQARALRLRRINRIRTIRGSLAIEGNTLTEAQITRIELSYSLAPRCDARGNCEIQQARFWYQGANGVERQGRVADMNLRQSRVLEPR